MRKIVVAASAAMVWQLATPAFAHGIGGRQDLPVPLQFFVFGAGLVLVLSFVALAVLWPTARFQGALAEEHVAAPVWRIVRPVLGALGVLGLLVVIVAGFIGPPSTSSNPGPVLVFVVFWLVVPFASVALGDIYPSVAPWRRIGDWIGFAAAKRETTLVPATVGFLAFTWFELISPYQEPVHVAVAAAAYTLLLLGVRAMGLSSRNVDAFAVYNRVLGGISSWARRDDGTVTRHGWLRALPHIPEDRGLVAFVVVMIGTVTYDGASATDWWSSAIELPLGRALFDLGFASTPATVTAATIAFLGVNLSIGAAYIGASTVAARLGGDGDGRWVAARFAHTLVPIAFAYAFAHYFTLILFEGQLVLSTMSDPFARGWNLLGMADRPISYALIQGSAAWVWYVQVAVIVAGHVAGVVLAHDRALGDFQGIRAVRSQYAMLVLMVLLTGLGLVILAAG